jgi:alpha-galactosidase
MALAGCVTDNISHGPIHGAATQKASAPAGSASSLLVWVDEMDLTRATQEEGKTNKNQSAENNPLTLKGKTFKHGVGTHANGLIVIDLKGAALSFSAIVGVDDDAGEEGSVGFTVIGDGKVLARTGTIRGPDPVREIKADLKGVQQLVLKSDSGDDDNITNDHADWAEACITLDPAKAGTKIETIAANLARLPG